MSRLGKKPVSFPASVKVSVKEKQVSIKGAKGELVMALPSGTAIQVNEASRVVEVSRWDDLKQSRANHGLTRALLANMVKGVSEGFQRRLFIYGTGYNCKLQGRKLMLNIGFMGRGQGRPAQFQIDVPAGLEVQVEVEAARGENDPAKLVIRGCDKQRVGDFAARIRSLRKAEPYKGKGIRYENEVVRRKQGKALTGK